MVCVPLECTTGSKDQDITAKVLHMTGQVQEVAMQQTTQDLHTPNKQHVSAPPQGSELIA